jgi:hypothetical protein
MTRRALACPICGQPRSRSELLEVRIELRSLQDQSRYRTKVVGLTCKTCSPKALGETEASLQGRFWTPDGAVSS